MLLFLPGLICDARIYAPQLAAFPESRAVDGYGQVDTLEGMARVALEQAPESFDLFGHSMGGRVALEVFRLAPERVRRLALSSTGVHALGANETGNRRALQALGHDEGFAALVGTWLPPMVAEANRSTTSGGVPAGAITPYHGTASARGWPTSASVGTSGSAGKRAREVTAITRNCPPEKPSTEGSETNISLMRDAMRSVKAAAAPRYGTCSTLSRARAFRSSMMRCVFVPVPVLA